MSLKDANPVNPMLSAMQLAEILRAARTKVLVTLGPASGSDIHAKVLQIKDQLPDLRTILVVGADGTLPKGEHDFDALLAGCPDDRLVSGVAVEVPGNRVDSSAMRGVSSSRRIPG